jgi:hypothetical protein
LQSLFDIVRVTGTTVRYEPIGAGQAQTSTTPLHQPMVIVYDPVATAASTFAVLASNRDFNEPQCFLRNTGRPFTLQFHFETGKKVVENSSTPANLGVWIPSGGTNFGNLGGGVQIAARTTTANDSITFGTLFWTWDCEWSNRNA